MLTHMRRRRPLAGRGRGLAVSVAVAAAAGLLIVGAGQASAAVKVCPSGCTYTTIPAALASQERQHDPDHRRHLRWRLHDRQQRQSGRGWGRQDDTSGGGQVVTVASGVSVKISGVTITGGTTSDWVGGGGIGIYGGTLTLTTSIVDDNTAGPGGGIANGGTVTLTNSHPQQQLRQQLRRRYLQYRHGHADQRPTLSNNTASGGADVGGGIANGGTVTLTNCTLIQ